jgi:hypothetical protein
MKIISWLMIIAALGCGGGTQGPSGTPQGPLGACLPIVPLRLLVLEHGHEWEPIAEVLADGTFLYYPKGRTPVARIANDFVTDMQGKPLVGCVNRELRVPGHTTTAHFEPKTISSRPGRCGFT